MDQDDKQKKQKLVNYLDQAVTEHQKGQKQKFLMICEEISNKKKNCDYLRLWMAVLIEKLGQLQVKKQNYSLIVDLVLYKIPWFNNSPNHLNIVYTYEKFLLALISLNPSYISVVYKSLISKFVPMEIAEKIKQQSKSSMQLKVEQRTFANQALLLNKIKKILNFYEIEKTNEFKQLNTEDEQFMHEIFKHHPNFEEKSKNFYAILVGKQNQALKIYKAFYLQKPDQIEDISFIKSVNNLVDQTYQANHLQHYQSEQSQNENSSLIQIIIKLNRIYPLHQKKLLQLIQEFYPHKIKSEIHHKIYITTLIKIGLQQIYLLPYLLSMIIESFIQIDTEIKIDLLEENSDFCDSNQDLQNDQSEIKQKIWKKEQIIDEMARKLDWLMIILLQFLKVFFQGQGGLSNDILFQNIQVTEEQQEYVFKEILEVFNSKILVTHQSKFVQFFMFYLTSIDQKYLEMFLKLLIRNIIYKDRFQYASQKINSIYFLGSFLARAKFCSDETYLEYIKPLTDYMKEYTEKNQHFREIDFEPDQQIKQHNIFYHMMQIVIYMICFKFDSLGQRKQQIFNEICHIMREGFDVGHFLNKRIFQEFQVQCKKLDDSKELIDYLEQIENKNKSNKFSLESFFPFDPYLLEYSEQYFKNQYRYWKLQGQNEKNENNNENKNFLNIHNTFHGYSTANSENFSEPALTPEIHDVQYTLKRKKLPIIQDDQITKKINLNDMK